MKKHLGDRTQGFTIIETLLAVIIIGILGAIAIPSWISFLNIRYLNAAQDEVYQAIRQAQNNAKHEKITWQASFREVGTVLQWAVHPANVSPSNAKWNIINSKVRLDSETTLQNVDGVRQVRFDHRGNVRQPPLGRITLSVRDGGTAKRCVFVSTILGALRTAQEHSQPEDGKYCY